MFCIGSLARVLRQLSGTTAYTVEHQCLGGSVPVLAATCTMSHFSCSPKNTPTNVSCVSGSGVVGQANGCVRCSLFPQQQPKLLFRNREQREREPAAFSTRRSAAKRRCRKNTMAHTYML